MAWRDRALGRTPRWSVVTNGGGVSLHPCLARPTGSWLAAQAWLVPQPLAFAASAEAWVRGRVSAGASEAASLIQWGRPPMPLLAAGPESSGGSDWRLSPPRGPHPQAPASWPRSAFPRRRSISVIQLQSSQRASLFRGSAPPVSDCPRQKGRSVESVLVRERGSPSPNPSPVSPRSFPQNRERRAEQDAQN